MDNRDPASNPKSLGGHPQPRRGGRKVAELFLAAGHRRIAYIAGWEGASTQRDREKGFTDRLREAVFNILTGTIQEALVLDLFAGTGALGIEALSRGARQAVFIDNNREAVALITRNIQQCGLENRSTVLRWDITRNLDCLYRTDKPYDLVFLDPPYERGLVLSTLQFLLQHHFLATAARVVVEHAASEVFLPLPNGLDVTDTRKYGKSLVSFLVAVV